MSVGAISSTLVKQEPIEGDVTEWNIKEENSFDGDAISSTLVKQEPIEVDVTEWNIKEENSYDGEATSRPAEQAPVPEYVPVQNLRQEEQHFGDEAMQDEITQTLHESKQTSDVVSQPPFLNWKKTSSKTSRIVHSEEAQCPKLIKKAVTVFSHQDDEYDTLGKTYAAKLRRMPAAQRDIADKLINDILFKGLQNHLTPPTFISNYGYTSGAWVSSHTPSPVSIYSNPTPSVTLGPSNYPVHPPEQDPGTVFPPY